MLNCSTVEELAKSIEDGNCLSVNGKLEDIDYAVKKCFGDERDSFLKGVSNVTAVVEDEDYNSDEEELGLPRECWTERVSASKNKRKLSSCIIL